MTAIEELYRAAKGLDDAATPINPLHALTDYEVPSSPIRALMRALRRYEREALSDGC